MDKGESKFLINSEVKSWGTEELRLGFLHERTYYKFLNRKSDNGYYRKMGFIKAKTRI